MLQFVRDHALWFVIAWPIVALVCGLIVAQIVRHNEAEYPTVYDHEAPRFYGDDHEPDEDFWSVERAGVDATSSWDSPGSLSDYQGSWERDSGHGASW